LRLVGTRNLLLRLRLLIATRCLLLLIGSRSLCCLLLRRLLRLPLAFRPALATVLLLAITTAAGLVTLPRAQLLLRRLLRCLLRCLLPLLVAARLIAPRLVATGAP
jgi:hypothetical protein